MKRAHIAQLLLLAMCIGFGWWWWQIGTASQLPPPLDLRGVFTLIASDLERMHDGRFPAELIAKDSWSETTSVSGHEFLVVYADVRRPDSSISRIRGSNGPIYVFEKKRDGFEPVGGFVGNGVLIILRGDKIIAQEFWHSSAAAELPHEHAYHVDGFRHWATSSE